MDRFAAALCKQVKVKGQVRMYMVYSLFSNSKAQAERVKEAQSMYVAAVLNMF